MILPADGSPVPGAGRWFDDGAAYFVAVAECLWNPIGQSAAAQTAVRPGDSVLDLCCGAGASALPLAAAVGPAGHVDAVDVSPRLVAAGRAAAIERGMRNVDFVVADATSWHAPDPTYDALACVLGVYLLPDMTATMRDLIGSGVRAGGCVVLTCWTQDGMQPLARLLWDAVAARPSGRIEPGAEPPSVFLQQSQPLFAWADELGLADTRLVEDPRTVTLDERLAWAVCTGTGFAALLEPLTVDDREQVRADVVAGMAAAGWRMDASVRHLVGARAS